MIHIGVYCNTLLKPFSCFPPPFYFVSHFVLSCVQLNIVRFLAKRLFETSKVGHHDNAGLPFKKVLEEVRFLSLPRAKVSYYWLRVYPAEMICAGWFMTGGDALLRLLVSGLGLPPVAGW